MLFRLINYITLAFAFTVAASSPLLAEEFYYWVDENGVPNFSQWAPANPVDDLTKEPLPASEPVPYNPDEDLYAVQATQEAMQSLRDEMEQRREAARAQKAAAQPKVIYQQPVEYTAFPYWYPGFRPRPPRPPRPEPRPVTSVPFKPPGS